MTESWLSIQMKKRKKKISESANVYLKHLKIKLNVHTQFKCIDRITIDYNNVIHFLIIEKCLFWILYVWHYDC